MERANGKTKTINNEGIGFTATTPPRGELSHFLGFFLYKKEDKEDFFNIISTMLVNYPHSFNVWILENSNPPQMAIQDKGKNSKIYDEIESLIKKALEEAGYKFGDDYSILAEY